MYYPASATIAAEHPPLFEDIKVLDSYLADLYGAPFPVDIAADILDFKPDYLERLLQLYEEQEVVSRRAEFMCPRGDYLEEDASGQLWCDICDTFYEPEDCRQVIVYYPKLLSVSENSENARRKGKQNQSTDLKVMSDDITNRLKQLHVSLRDARRYVDLLEQQAIGLGPGPTMASTQLAIEKQRVRISDLEQQIDEFMTSVSAA